MPRRLSENLVRPATLKLKPNSILPMLIHKNLPLQMRNGVELKMMKTGAIKEINLKRFYFK
jgi:hypothetical protein